ncbi:putative vomeronasal receptor-like protein 4 [Equus quagga]|uniref:Vomeronasal type-1 receptor n=2 Tax=Equus TaxID=9789 RepID=F7CA32_HORSE|nr:vomeronasal 1 receptor equCabV1R910 [Equus caballus]XP_014694468.1 putative vomeronasal receptor-like protein 4 [Equus asinus]XP_046494993.1 putative vomeronasal receptor-like protein 4 [Equus quagga]
MLWNNLIQGMFFLSVTGPGIGGNFFLFVERVYKFVMGVEKKPIDLILIHLAFTNEMTLCAKGISDIISAFHFNNFLGSAGCKTVLYLGRVARGLSICTTCLLSVVQAITVSARTTSWRKLKPQTAWQVLPYLLLLWIFNFLISSNLLYYITTVNSTSKSEISPYVGYCYMLPSRQIVRWFFVTLMALRDIIFQSLMGWSSGYLAFHLYKHHKCVLYLQSSRFQKKSSPEIRATQSVLILMSCFLFFYWTDLIFSFYMGSFLISDYIIFNIEIFLASGYASFSPFVLITRNGHVANYWRTH